jgi:hypothetical protein
VQDINLIRAREYAQAITFLTEADQYRVALEIGVASMTCLERSYFDLMCAAKGHSTVTSRDFSYTKEDLKNLRNKAKKLYEKIEPLEQLTDKDIYLILNITDEISKFWERIKYLNGVLSNKLSLGKIFRLFRSFMISTAKNRVVQGTAVLIVVGVLCYSALLNLYDFMVSLPTGTYYSASANKIFSSGWSNYYPKYKNRWNSGKTSEISLQIKPAVEDKRLDVYLNGFIKSRTEQGTSRQRVKAYIGKVLLGTEDAVQKQKIAFLIPKTLLATNNIIIRFEFPDAQSPSSLKLWKDDTERAICLEGFSIDKAEAAPYYRLGKIIKAGKKSQKAYFLNGWYEPYEDYRWAVGGYSEILIRKPDTKKDLSLSVKARWVLSKPGVIGSQRVKVYINGKYLTELNFTSESLGHIVAIPQSMLAGSKKIVIGFECPDAAVPKKLGLWEDNNRLSFALKELRIIAKK